MADKKSPDPTLPDVPEELKRLDPRPDRPDSLPEVSEDIAHAGISPSADGDNPDHPIHDEDMEDLEPDDFEEMIDEKAPGPVDKVLPR